MRLLLFKEKRTLRHTCKGGRKSCSKIKAIFMDLDVRVSYLVCLRASSSHATYIIQLGYNRVNILELVGLSCIEYVFSYSKRSVTPSGSLLHLLIAHTHSKRSVTPSGSLVQHLIVHTHLKRSVTPSGPLVQQQKHGEEAA